MKGIKMIINSKNAGIMSEMKINDNQIKKTSNC